jgi:hypothetical protein
MGRARAQLVSQMRLVRWDRLIGFGALASLLISGGWLLFRITHVCPDVRTALFTAYEVARVLDGQHVTPVAVHDRGVETRGGIVVRAAVGRTGIIAVVWPDATMRLLTDDHRWDARLTPRYTRDALNVSFYALRGGSEAEKAQVRVTISRAYRHLYPARPRMCQDE